MHDRLALATKFVAALHDVSRRNPASWRRISAIGARTGIKGDQLEQVVADAVTAGLVERRADEPGFVILTNEGWGSPGVKGGRAAPGGLLPNVTRPARMVGQAVTRARSETPRRQRCLVITVRSAGRGAAPWQLAMETTPTMPLRPTGKRISPHRPLQLLAI